jgi:hypothetical protein
VVFIRSLIDRSAGSVPSGRRSINRWGRCAADQARNGTCRLFFTNPVLGTVNRPGTARVATMLCLAVVLISGWATSASAAGNAALAGYIVANPVPGLAPAAPAQVAANASQLQAVEDAAIKGTGVTATVASDGWHRSGSRTKFLLIDLIAISAPGKSTSLIISAADEAAAAGAASFCSGAAASLPIISRGVPHLPYSHYVLCKRSPDGPNAEAITTARANVTAFIVSSEQFLDRSALEAVALRQYRSMSQEALFQPSNSDFNLPL